MNFPLEQLNYIIPSPKLKKGLISIWGDFGVGKTTFALQTALYNCTFDNIVIFIYTKPNLPLKQIERIDHKFSENKNDNFFLYQILNFSELFEFILNLELLIIKLKKRHKKTNFLIVIDSITNLYQIELRKDRKKKNILLNYKLNQILATLSYLKLQYPLDILIVNYLRRIKRENHTIEIQSGGKVMKYWLEYSIKIERDKKINSRKFLILTESETEGISFLAELSEYGFQ